MQRKDVRIKLLNEVVNAIRVIKVIFQELSLLIYRFLLGKTSFPVESTISETMNSWP